MFRKGKQVEAVDKRGGGKKHTGSGMEKKEAGGKVVQEESERESSRHCTNSRR